MKKRKIDVTATKNFENYQLSLLDDEKLKEKIIQLDEKMGDAFIVYLLSTSLLVWLSIFRKILITKSNIKDGKVDLGMKNKVDEALDIFESIDLKYI